MQQQQLQELLHTDEKQGCLPGLEPFFGLQRASEGFWNNSQVTQPLHCNSNATLQLNQQMGNSCQFSEWKNFNAFPILHQMKIEMRMKNINHLGLTSKFRWLNNSCIFLGVSLKEDFWLVISAWKSKLHGKMQTPNLPKSQLLVTLQIESILPAEEVPASKNPTETLENLFHPTLLMYFLFFWLSNSNDNCPIRPRRGQQWAG